eukprot:1711000-Amphidinium_carterae.1
MQRMRSTGRLAKGCVSTWSLLEADAVVAVVVFRSMPDFCFFRNAHNRDACAMIVDFTEERH